MNAIGCEGTIPVYNRQTCQAPDFDADVEWNVCLAPVQEKAADPPAITPPVDPAKIPPRRSKLEQLLRIDPASGKIPVRDYQWRDYYYVEERSNWGGIEEVAYSLNGDFLGGTMPEVACTPYNTSSQITAPDGTVIGYYNFFEIYNQAGEMVALKRGETIIYEGKEIGYFSDDDRLYSTEGGLIGKQDYGCGKILHEGKIIGNTVDGWRKSANDLFFWNKFGEFELSPSTIKNLRKQAGKFQPATAAGKKFRQELDRQIRQYEEAWEKISGNPQKALQKAKTSFEKVVVLWFLAGEEKMDPAALSFINTTALNDPSSVVRYHAVRILARLKLSPETLASALNDPEELIQEAALQGLYAMRKDTCHPAYPDDFIAQSIFKAIFIDLRLSCQEKTLGILREIDPYLVERLMAFLQDKNYSEEQKESAVDALDTLGAKEIERLIPSLPSFAQGVRQDLASALAKNLPHRRWEVAEMVRRDPAPEVRSVFLYGLEHSGGDQAAALAFSFFFFDANSAVRDNAAFVLFFLAREKVVLHVEVMLALLQSEHVPDFIKEKAARDYSVLIKVLRSSTDDRSLELLEAFLSTPYLQVHENALEALRSIAYTKSPKPLPILLRYRKKMLDEALRYDFLSALEEVDIKENLDAWKSYIPELREMLADRNWDIRKFAAQRLIRLGDDFLSLLDRLAPRLFDATLLQNIGYTIGNTGNEKLLKEVAERAFSARDLPSLKKYTYILIGIMEEREDKAGLADKLQKIYLRRLKDPRASVAEMRFAVDVLIKIALITGDAKRAELIARKLLQIKGPLKTFILKRLLALSKYLPPSLLSRVEEMVSHLLIVQQPSYEEIFNPKTNPNRVVQARIYLKHPTALRDWLQELSGSGYLLIGAKDNTTMLGKKLNGVTLRVELVDMSGEQGKLNINLYQDLADPSLHYVGYSGHSGMGGNLEMRGPSDPGSYGAKILHIGACWSMSSYYSRALSRFPGVQFIGNVDPSFCPDDAKVFAGTMDGIAFRKSWEEIDTDVKAKAPFTYHWHPKYQKPADFFNHMLPNDLGQFKYAVLDSLSMELGADILTYAAPQQSDLLEINTEHGGRLRQAVQNANVFFSYWPFFEGAEITTGDEVYSGTYFLSATDEQTVLEVARASDHEHPIYSVKVNAGYSHLTVDALSLLIIYELNAHFSKEKHAELTTEDKLRGLLMVVEYIHYHYQGRELEGQEMFERLKQKYGFPGALEFSEIWSLQKALDDHNIKEKERLEGQLLALICPAP